MTESGGHLRVRVRLPELIAAAQAQWGRVRTRRPVTPMQVRTGVQAHQATIEAYLDDSAAKVRFEMLARLCWFFGCPIDSLLGVEQDGRAPAPVVIGRATMPEQFPPAGSGAIRVLNFMPGEVALHVPGVRAATDWHREAVLQLAAGGQTGVGRQTLTTLLTVLGLARVSQLVEVQCDLDAADPSATKLADAIRIIEPRPTWLAHWEETVQQWRGLAEQTPAPGAVTPVDLAALRYLARQWQPTMLGRLDLLAAGLGIRRSFLRAILEQQVHPEISPNDLPPPVQRFLDDVAPIDWHAQAAADAEQAYQEHRSRTT
ncbi:MAG TPA: helix-turn-helix transcriptional regulator [Herpetosiphonaceae bacterium]